MAMKQGRLSKIEQQYIADNCKQKKYDQIALELNREPMAIKRYIEEKLNLSTSLAVNAPPVKTSGKSQVREKPFWVVLEQQFSPEELNVFEMHWVDIMRQFDADVLPTEQMQVIDVIKLELIMNRNLRDQQDSTNLVRNIELQLSMEKDKPVDQRPPVGQDPQVIKNLETQLTILRTSKIQLQRDYRELQDRKNKLFEGLKATRADRITRIEKRRESFLSWLESLIENPNIREELGMRMEKMRLASIDEQIRLAAYHTYEDDRVDQPILTPETVKEDNL